MEQLILKKIQSLENSFPEQVITQDLLQGLMKVDRDAAEETLQSPLCRAFDNEVLFLS
jgi:hypothetical protein